MISVTRMLWEVIYLYENQRGYMPSRLHIGWLDWEELKKESGPYAVFAPTPPVRWQWMFEGIPIELMLCKTGVAASGHGPCEDQTDWEDEP